MWKKDLSDYVEGCGEDDDLIMIPADDLDTFDYDKIKGNNEYIEEDNIKFEGGNYNEEYIDYLHYNDYNEDNISGASSGQDGRIHLISLGEWARIGGQIQDKYNNEINQQNNSNDYIEFEDDESKDSILEFEDENLNLEFIGGDDDEISSSISTKDNNKFTINEFRSILPEKITECSIGRVTVDPSFQGICTSDEIMKSAASALGVISSRPINDVVKDVKNKTGCNTEICILRNKKVIEKIGDDVITEEISKNFKLSGPVDITLLSNINIDDAILNQWMVAFPDFFNMGFTMSDFDQRNLDRNIETDRTGNGLGRNNIANIYEAGFKTAASVLNTDVHSGAGKHWMAMFIDMRSPKLITIEFFNSSGNIPQINFKNWMSAAKTILEEKVKGAEVKDLVVTRYMHQHSRTECGVYALYYIWARLNGIPYSVFRSSRVPDELMLEFRQHLFAGKIFRSGEQWDYNRYKNIVKVKWESGFSY